MTRRFATSGRWLWMLGVVAIYATAAACAFGRAGASSKEPTSSASPQPTDGPSSYRTEVTLSSLDCDVVMWRRIFFRNENDAVIAEADSGGPLGDTYGGCVVHFVAELPKAKFYVLDNGTRRNAPISFDELKAKHFQMDVALR